MKLCLYLVETGKISADQALFAFRHQLSMRPPIGQIAVENDLMTASQVFDVLSVQLDSPKPFGTIAIELGFLTRDQLSDVILQQLDRAPSLSSILITSGLVTIDDVEAAERYQRGSELETLDELTWLTSSQQIPRRQNPGQQNTGVESL